MSAETLERWVVQIDSVSSEVRANFSGLGIESLNAHPEPGKWSIGQHLDHLIIINSSYYPVFEDLVAGRLKLTWTSKVGFLVNFFGKAILKSMQPENTRKTTTMPIWEPAKEEIKADIVDRFLAHQEEFKAKLVSIKAQIGQNAIIPSPANKNINYRLEDALDIICTHEKRHVKHALNVLSVIG